MWPIFSALLALAPICAGADANRATMLFAQAQASLADYRFQEACARFEESRRMVFTPLTSFYLGKCQRTLGQRLRALGTLMEAQERNAAYPPGASLGEQELKDLDRLVSGIRAELAVVLVTLDPEDATVAIDGAPLDLAPKPLRPLEPGHALLAAGVAPAGPGQVPSARTFELVIEVGTHAIYVAKKGFRPPNEPPPEFRYDADVWSGAKPLPELRLSLSPEPARLVVDSDQRQARVLVNNGEMGQVRYSAAFDQPAPILVTVRKKGFYDFNERPRLQPGEEAAIFAHLNHRPPFYRSGWFWGTIAAVTALATGGVLFGTLYHPDYQRGNADWLAQPTPVVGR